jgi:Icc-related predicted phosphoesterase
MIIDLISDLHGFYPKLEGGDLLIVGGDWTRTDSFDELQYFEKEWLRHQDYKKIILIAGNHDNMAYEAGWYGRIKIAYLQDSGIEFEGLQIWGSPWSLTFPGMNPLCKAFTVDTEEELQEKWDLIPEDTDILITHTPPYGILDGVLYAHIAALGSDDKYIRHCGSRSLYERLKQVRPRIHCFGHIHEAYGMHRPYLECIKAEGYPIFVNASHVNEKYQPVNQPIRIEL